MALIYQPRWTPGKEDSSANIAVALRWCSDVFGVGASIPGLSDDLPCKVGHWKMQYVGKDMQDDMQLGGRLTVRGSVADAVIYIDGGSWKQTGLLFFEFKNGDDTSDSQSICEALCLEHYVIQASTPVILVKTNLARTWRFFFAESTRKLRVVSLSPELAVGVITQLLQANRGAQQTSDTIFKVGGWAPARCIPTLPPAPKKFSPPGEGEMMKRVRLLDETDATYYDYHLFFSELVQPRRAPPLTRELMHAMYL